MDEPKQNRQLVGIVNHPTPNKGNPKVPCGAITRSGEPCLKAAITGKARCRTHGGNNPGPPKFNQHAAKHDLYSKILFPEEESWVRLMRDENGGMSMMTELEVLRVQFLRAAVAQKKWLAFRERLDELTNDMLDSEMRRMGVMDRYELHHHEGVKAVEGKDGEGATIPFDDLKVVKRQRDYSEEMRDFGKVIDRLMRTQQELVGSGDDDDAVGRMAEDLQAFHTKAAAMMPGGRPHTQEDANGKEDQ